MIKIASERAAQVGRSTSSWMMGARSAVFCAESRSPAVQASGSHVMVASVLGDEDRLPFAVENASALSASMP